MSEVPTSQQAIDFCEKIFASTGLKLKVRLKQGIVGEDVLDFYGPDEELLQTQTGELLEALQHIVNQIFARGHTGVRIVCDVHGFRATREAELQAMANLAAKRVRDTGQAFTFEPMTANERRIIHLTLADSEDLLTESIGEGSERKLKVRRK